MVKISICLCTYNGEEFILEQLESIREQSVTNWDLYISDDGSTDATLDIIKQFAVNNPDKKINVLSGPNRGFVINFLSLLRIVEADYLFFCDQDDIWFPDKLQKYIDLAPTPNIPTLIAGRTLIVDRELNVIRKSKNFSRFPSFSNALVQSIAGGNTMAVTRAARELLLKANDGDYRLISHDWWIYLILSGAGAKIIYYPDPCILYRQHSSNLIGENNTLAARIKRIMRLLQGDFSIWIDANLDCLNDCQDLLTEQNKNIFYLFREGRKSNLIRRIMMIKRSGVYRQTRLENIALWVAILFGKL